MALKTNYTDGVTVWDSGTTGGTSGANAMAFQINSATTSIGTLQTSCGGLLTTMGSHTHNGTGSSQLDWDTCWSDAVHSHASDAEGGVLTGYVGTVSSGVKLLTGYIGPFALNMGIHNQTIAFGFTASSIIAALATPQYVSGESIETLNANVYSRGTDASGSTVTFRIQNPNTASTTYYLNWVITYT